MNIAVKRIYDPPAGDDGTRVLTDRLWPRGVSKDEAAFDLWCKDLAPSPELRKWFNHDPARFEAFARRYRKELAENPAAVEDLFARIDRRKRLTLLTATKDLACSHVQVLKQHLASR